MHNKAKLKFFISKETFLMVQEEMARRARTQLPFGGKKGYSANHAFSQIIFCAGCGEQFAEYTGTTVASVIHKQLKTMTEAFRVLLQI